MPSILSKQIYDQLLGSKWSFGYNCYETAHTWTPICTDAALEVATATLYSTIPLYTALYAFTQIAIQREYDLSATWKSFKSVIRSSSFIFFHAYNGAAIGCALRNSLGRFYYRALVCLPGLLSSYLALLIEKPARRQALAFYMLNLASEIIYRMAVTKGYFKPIKHGETILFALSCAALYRLIKEHGYGKDPVSAAMKLLIGRDEATRRRNTNGKSKYQQSTGDTNTIVSDPLHKIGLDWRKHPCCPHRERNCLHYILGPAPTRFLLGYLIQSMLGLTRNPIMLIQSPWSTIQKSFKSAHSVRFGLFLAALVTGGRLTSCILRHLTDSEQAWHSSASGFVAGLSMLWMPRSSISMYIMWKTVELYYMRAVERKQVRFFDFTILTIYAASASTILYTFALEPRFVRPSYMKFLDKLSDHRIHQLNRQVLDVFGTGSSVGYEDYFPDLDPKLMSNQFKELIFNWMIQPYE